MKKSFMFIADVKLLLLMLPLIICSLPLSAQEHLEWGDQGDGTYKNPILAADYSDPDVIRVGEKYYMVASDFHFIGMQVLESDDMVNWHVISQIYNRFDLPGWDSNNHYGGGSWAPGIRYHDGKFWVYFCTPEEGLFMSNAEKAEGPWSPLHCVKAVEKWEDPCPFWDEDGQAYLGHSLHGAGPIIVHKMSADGKRLLDEGKTVYTGPVAEGTKFLKRNGYYYLIIPEGGVWGGWQTCLRSKNIYGPYEKKVVLEQGSTNVNGPHQGALVDTPEGEWWFYHFQDKSPLGRIVHLQPAKWEDDWLKIGEDYDGNGIGEPVAAYKKPNTGISNSQPSTPQTSDDFNGTKLGMQWQWCHNPHNDAWNIEDGKLILKALPADSLKDCHNMLTQKVMGYESVATTLIDASKIRDAYSGLLCIGGTFMGLGICKDGVYIENNGKRESVMNGSFNRVYLRLNIDTRINSFQFSISRDGKDYQPVWKPFQMQSGFWKGVRIGLFCYGKDGKAAFDWFHYDIKK